MTPRRTAEGKRSGAAQERVRVLQAQLDALQGLARIGFWEWDPSAHTVTWSPFMWELHGLAPQAVPLRPADVVRMVHKDDRAKMRKVLYDRGWSGIPREFDYRICIKGDCTVLLHARTEVERGPDGKVLRVVGTSQDVTEERRQEVLREREFLASIVDSSNDAIVTKDLDGTITSWNRAAEELFGYAAGEIVGKHVTTLFPPGQEDEESQIIAHIARGERIEPFETKRRRKDGTLVDVSVAISPLRDREGRIVGASKVARDITPQKREQARERAAIDQEIRRLDEMQRFRARFLNVAAHELKTPLTPIRLQLQLLALKLTDTPEPIQRSLAVLTRSVERLRLLMDDVLDAARVQATHLRLRKEPMDLGRVVYEALETYAAVAKKAGVQVHLDLPQEVPVVGDPTRLLQVVNNVLSNALKFTPAGGTIAVTLRADGDSALLTVRDSGRGLTPAQRDQLFQPFAQVHPDLEATSKGSGLGLFIVKAIVEQHGGTIALESDGPDRGSVVTVRLPLQGTKTDRPSPGRRRKRPPPATEESPMETRPGTQPRQPAS
ncbi:MAG: PAS domain S-box protein [Thermoplasmatota archaeon]